jgi:hypothetical protein
MVSIGCPACGSDNVEITEKSVWLYESLGPRKSVKIVENKCTVCGTTGDFNNQNEILFKEAFSELKTETAVSILEHFQDNKFNLSSLERALELPQRTFAKWKNRSVNPSATGVVLLKYLKTFPWLIEVADKHFDQNAADKILLENAFKKFLTQMKNMNIEVNSGSIFSDDSSLVYLELSNQLNNIQIPSTDDIPQMMYSK